jgi:hypothetical protein
MYAKGTIVEEDTPEQLEGMYKIEALEEALNEVKRLVKINADPKVTMTFFSKTKTSSDWIIVMAHMASWYYNTQKKKEGK